MHHAPQTGARIGGKSGEEELPDPEVPRHFPKAGLETATEGATRITQSGLEATSASVQQHVASSASGETSPEEEWRASAWVDSLHTSTILADALLAIARTLVSQSTCGQGVAGVGVGEKRDANKSDGEENGGADEMGVRRGVGVGVGVGESEGEGE
eukprot:6081951-Pleurochrysis_carterae.AAC.1